MQENELEEVFEDVKSINFMRENLGCTFEGLIDNYGKILMKEVIEKVVATAKHSNDENHGNLWEELCYVVINDPYNDIDYAGIYYGLREIIQDFLNSGILKDIDKYALYWRGTNNCLEGFMGCLPSDEETEEVIFKACLNEAADQYSKPGYLECFINNHLDCDLTKLIRLYGNEKSQQLVNQIVKMMKTKSPKYAGKNLWESFCYIVVNEGYFLDSDDNWCICNPLKECISKCISSEMFTKLDLYSIYWLEKYYYEDSMTFYPTDSQLEDVVFESCRQEAGSQYLDYFN